MDLMVDAMVGKIDLVPVILTGATLGTTIILFP